MSMIMARFEQVESIYTNELYDEPILRKRPVDQYVDNSNVSSSSEAIRYFQQEDSPIRVSGDSVVENVDANFSIQDEEYHTGTVWIPTWSGWVWWGGGYNILLASAGSAVGVTWQKFKVENGFIKSCNEVEGTWGCHDIPPDGIQCSCIHHHTCRALQCVDPTTKNDAHGALACGRNQAKLCDTTPGPCDADCECWEDCDDCEECDCDCLYTIYGGDGHGSVINSIPTQFTNQAEDRKGYRQLENGDIDPIWMKRCWCCYDYGNCWQANFAGEHEGDPVD